jgi:hypothetical protein
MTEAIFTYPIAGSITNGKFIVVKRFSKRIITTLRENLFGKPRHAGISLGIEEINFLMSIRFAIIMRNTPQNIKVEEKRNLTVTKILEKNIEKLRFKQLRGCSTSTMDIHLSDFFNKVLPFMNYMKTILEISRNGCPEQQIFETVGLITHQRKKEREESGLQWMSRYETNLALCYDDMFNEIEPMEGADVCGNMEYPDLFKENTDYVAKLLRMNLVCPHKDFFC